MELTTDLVVKVVVLLTAIVGLIKVANIKIAEPFLIQLLSALSILVIPAVMLGFLWISTTTVNMMSRPKSTTNWSGPEALIMYQLTREFWNQSQRQDALKLTIEKAFETNQWSVVVDASRDLNPTSQRDEILMRAIKVLSGKNEAKTK
jgi:hypothetical protein